MKFKRFFSALTLILFVFSSIASASITIKEDGAVKGQPEVLNISTGLTATMSSNDVATITADPSDITSAVFEGSTTDAFETTLDVVDPTADNTFRLPDASGYALYSTLATNKVDAANSVWAVSNGIVYEGATADAFETTLAFADAAADATVTVSAVTGSVKPTAATAALTAGAAVTLTVVPGAEKLYTDTITTDNEDQTITFSAGGSAGDIVRILFVTDTGGSGDEVITFDTTLTNSAGTLTLANLTAGRYVVTFQSDGTVWNEVSRTAALS